MLSCNVKGGIAEYSTEYGSLQRISEDVFLPSSSAGVGLQQIIVCCGSAVGLLAIY